MADVEFWFEFASNYSYLSVMRIGELAAARGVRIVWRPFLLGPIFRSFGWDTSPFVLQQAKGAYVWRDMERLARKYGLAWRKPSEFPRHSVLAARVATCGGEAAWVPQFAREVMAMNFAQDQDIASPQALAPVLTRLGLDAQQVLDDAQSDANRELLRARTTEAQRRGVFGAPTFFVAGEMFWGNDRLEDALEFARSR